MIAILARVLLDAACASSAAQMSVVTARAAQPPVVRFRRETMRVDYFHTGGPASGRDARRSIASSTTARGRAAGRSSSTRPNLGKYSFEVRDKRRATACSTRAGSRRSTANGRRPREVRTAHRTSTSRCASRGRSSRFSVTLQKRQPDNRFAPIWSTDVDPASRFVNAAPLRAARGDGLDRLRERPGGGEGRPAGHQRGLHRSGAAEVPQGRRRGCVDALFAEEPFKSRQARLQRPRARSAVGRRAA